MHHKKKQDLAFSDSGDFVFDTIRKDIGDTKEVMFGALRQQIMTRIQSSMNDWTLQPGLGVGLNRFIGLPNTQETGKLIKQAIVNNFNKFNFMRNSEYTVEVFPLNRTHIGILIVVIPTGELGQLRFNFRYSLKDNKIIPRNV